ncbi:MAG: hypothetical protein AAGI13_14835, partial [Pseudomonadota bacterium]
LQQVERLALEGPLESAPLGPALVERLCQTAGVGSQQDLETKVAQARETAARIVAAHLPEPPEA